MSEFIDEIHEATEYIGGLIVENERLKVLLREAVELLDDRASDAVAVEYMEKVVTEFPDL